MIILSIDIAVAKFFKVNRLMKLSKNRDFVPRYFQKLFLVNRKKRGFAGELATSRC